MSGFDEASEYDAPFPKASARANEHGAQNPARSHLLRFAEWRSRRRATRAERRAARQEEWTDQIPPWSFGILHR
ncbi:hypothetical protein [Agromyces albus]|uniref:Uncharacterized protein n=1 Tax=Agromyces albus TaxID=205332 RepID=A0A4Q2L6H0_9MICO|nr:hypothetical protein [Agromyces albus]RXZ73197.1 hypothetical protein ESP51_00400 [Agromyces albus]